MKSAIYNEKLAKEAIVIIILIALVAHIPIHIIPVLFVVGFIVLLVDRPVKEAFSGNCICKLLCGERAARQRALLALFISTAAFRSHFIRNTSDARQTTAFNICIEGGHIARNAHFNGVKTIRMNV